MKRLSTLILLFAILSAVFFLALVLLRIPFPLYPLMSWQDALDLLTPLVLLPLYWRMFEATSGPTSKSWEHNALIILSAAWAMGQGMHLAANSINNLAEALAHELVLDVRGTSLYKLIYFYDEYLSHYIWHIGVLGLAGLLLVRAGKSGNVVRTDWLPISISGVIYGLVLFLIILEGETLPMGLPVLILLAALVFLRGRTALNNNPIMAFFFIACLLATFLFVFWGLVWQGFPALSDLGWI